MREDPNVEFVEDRAMVDDGPTVIGGYGDYY